MDPNTGPLSKEIVTKLIRLESNPKSFESNYPTLLDWRQQATSAYYQMIRDTKKISEIE